MTFTDLSNNSREIVDHPPFEVTMEQHSSGVLIETVLVMVRLFSEFHNEVELFEHSLINYMNLQNMEAIKGEHLNENRFTARPITEVAAKIIPADRLL
jgi:hypothetical protein